MKITFHGAAQTVTGSQHLIEVNGYKLLLDCGLYQGRRKAMLARNRDLPYNPQELDAVILSHAHIDHSGNLPNLVKNGYTGRIYASAATRDLCADMLPDSGHIQERNAEWANRHRRSTQDEEVPIYTEADARKTLPSFKTVPFHEPREILDGVRLTFIEAGHMLGSATVILDVREYGKDRPRRIVFSGDIGRKGIPIIRDPQIPDSADILIMESTYGGRTHEPYAQTSDKLRKIIIETATRGGIILMPAFAVGRTQQLVVQLNELWETGQIPHLPIYVDSPLASNVTETFRNHPEAWDAELNHFLDISGDDDPFGFDDLTYIRDVEDSIALNDRTDPMVIISASGMMEFGRIVHHLKNRIEEPKNSILITGWMAPYTRGRQIVDRSREVKIFGHPYKNRIETHVLNGFSGHADHDELLAWVDGMVQPPRRVFLVHGEPEAAQALKADLEPRYQKMRVDIPNMDETFEVG